MSRQTTPQRADEPPSSSPAGSGRPWSPWQALAMEADQKLEAWIQRRRDARAHRRSVAVSEPVPGPALVHEPAPGPDTIRVGAPEPTTAA